MWQINKIKWLKIHFGQKAQGLFKVVNICSKVSDKKAQEFRHIYIDSMSAALIAPIPKIFVINVANFAT